MHFVLQIPSLQHLAGVKLVAELWNRRDTRAQIERVFQDSHESVEDENYLTNDKEEWLAIETKVKRNVSDLPLPQMCIEQLINFIKPLGYEIIEWGHYYSNRWRQFPENLFQQPFRWTMHGTVDYQKTAELMVENERLAVERRFDVACLNFLEEDARELFTSMGEERRREYIKRKDSFEPLIIFFSGSINIDVGQSRSLESYFGESSVNKRLFVTSVYGGNRAMCESLFPTLSPEEKEQVFDEYRVRVFREGAPTGNFLYYLCLMNEEQQERMFRECTGDLLGRLLIWPHQSLFSEAATRGWHLMNAFDCYCALRSVAVCIGEGYRDYDYAQLFWEGWRLSSADQKRYSLRRIQFLRVLLETKREEFIIFVLKEAPCRLIEKLVKDANGDGRVLMDETAISEAALMECTKDALISLNDGGDEERLRSQKLWRLEVVIVLLKKRSERRESLMDN